MEKTELIIVDALDRIEQAIYDSPIPRMRADNTLRMVNSDEIADMIADLKTQLPAEIRRANTILLQMDAKIQSATDYANKIAADAERSADETMLRANSAAQKAVNEADAYHAEKVASGDDYLAGKMQEGDAYYNERIAQANDEAAAIIEAANAERDRLISEHEVTAAAQQEAEEYRVQMAHRANQIFNNASRRADDVLATLMQYLEDYYNSIAQDRKALEIKQTEDDRKAEQSRQAAERRNEHREEPEEDDEPERGAIPSFFDIFKRKKKPQSGNNGDYDE